MPKINLLFKNLFFKFYYFSVYDSSLIFFFVVWSWGLFAGLEIIFLCFFSQCSTLGATCSPKEWSWKVALAYFIVCLIKIRSLAWVFFRFIFFRANWIRNKTKIISNQAFNKIYLWRNKKNLSLHYGEIKFFYFSMMER